MASQRKKDINVRMLLDTNRKLEESCDSKSKSRVSSLSSLFSSSMTEEGKHEVFGFRRFARSYLSGSGKQTKNDSSRHANKYQIVERTGSRNGVRYTIMEPPPPSLSRTKRRQAQDKMQDMFKLDYETRGCLLSLKERNFDFDLEANAGLHRIPDSFKDESGTPLMIEGKNFVTTSSSEYESGVSTEQGNSIVFSNIPDNTGIASVLSQICGGPLASIKEYRDGSNNKLTELEVSFLTREAALSFMSYGRTNLFKINGFHMTPQWSKNTEMDSALLTDSSCEDILGICRCLVLKKYLPSNAKAKNNDASKDSLLDKFDVVEIKRDFSEFGEILEIAPVVSRKLCISIGFYSIDSSMKAMFHYEDPNTYLHKKYFKSWAAWYGKDITDRPCIQL
ncbi:hypothetical protein HG535_0A06070 [Zygotorulaspora mrakii]|uniref:Uncharacterized protein n=1 Tax=Zygotorulaspora mrakii TaxID=42260 RepID=A0A7H9AWE1_ZYGMR|nr:uncharacterized protein HG535_0A06070 [Zygotorulaspora mrakii]QLG70665.1 hypothetical protein HG535_0A06070 [Zygotorulaspora mrakii]